MLKTLLWALIRAPLWAPILVPCLGHRQGLPNNVLEPPPHTPGKTKKSLQKLKNFCREGVRRNLCDEGRYTTRRYFFDFAEFVQIFVFAELSRRYAFRGSTAPPSRSSRSKTPWTLIIACVSILLGSIGAIVCALVHKHVFGGGTQGKEGGESDVTDFENPMASE